MNRDELITALKRLKVETGSLACLGCALEHSCSSIGCVLIREAVKELEAMRWIPVTEKLPPNDVRVAACAHDGWVFTGRNFTAGDEIHDGPDGVGWWMPLPAPPEEAAP